MDVKEPVHSPFMRSATRPLSARDMLPVAALLIAMFALGRFLQMLGREFIIVFSANVSMLTLFLVSVLFGRTKDWRVLPLLLLFLGMTVQLSLAIAVEVLGASGPDVSLWLLANPMFVPTLLGFATVLYLWRLFQAQAEMARREQYMAERLQLAQKYESLGLMAGGVAHDFNNLLTTILGNVELARYDAPPDSDVANCLKSIETAADRAAEITRQMLDFSGHGKFAADPVDLSALVRDLRRLVTSFVPETIRVDYELQENMPRILGDRSQLGQIVVNLVSNAAEAVAPETGRITVSTLAVQADADMLAQGVASQQPRPGTYAALRIADNGPGIDPHIQPRIFDPFVTTRQTGRGMGLPAVLGIVRGHQGTILVDSTPGKGATLTVLLPEARTGAQI